MKFYAALALVVTSALIFVASEASAKGRRRSYGATTTVYETRPVRRGSPANPNAAFAPPVFDNEPQVQNAAPREATKEPYMPVTLVEPETRKNSASSAVPAEAPAPVRQPTTTPADTSEPPLPDYPTEGR